ncbi:PLAC8-domain-containing protein [Gigaspora margarita]|uniref:PLAC8-domain-containing protein n=1 Tax=Gigaspora margarita TaxID=4874 RepID=A0A8H4EK89_GIGMA|nr:PLAC8-domain-containing protein [Gigaspora margarita]
MAYQGTPQMTTTGSQIVQEKTDVPGQPRQWKSKLFDCFSKPVLCLKTFCFPCITYGQTKVMLNNDKGCFINGCIYCCSINYSIYWLVGGMTRSDIRTRHNIEGSYLCDYCTHLWCFPCALIQEHREVEQDNNNIVIY